jgi:hypothetical protein
MGLPWDTPGLTDFGVAPLAYTPSFLFTNDAMTPEYFVFRSISQLLLFHTECWFGIKPVFYALESTA